MEKALNENSVLHGLPFFCC